MPPLDVSKYYIYRKNFNINKVMILITYLKHLNKKISRGQYFEHVTAINSSQLEKLKIRGMKEVLYTFFS